MTRNLIAFAVVTAPGVLGGAVVAQTGGPPDVGGASGWTGAGLLGLVLAWLMFRYLPAEREESRRQLDVKDAQTQAAIEAARAERADAEARHAALWEQKRVEYLTSLRELVARHDTDRKEMRAEFAAERLATLQALDKLTDRLTGAMKEIVVSLHDVRGQIDGLRELVKGPGAHKGPRPDGAKG